MEAGDEVVGEHDVAVGADLAADPRAVGRLTAGEPVEAVVGLVHPGLEQVAVGPVAAGEADHIGEAAVQLGDVAAAGRLVQAVDVLGDHRAEHPAALQVGDGQVGGVRLGAS